MAQQQDERISYFTSLCEQLYNPKSPGHNVQTILEASFPIFSGPSSAVVDHGYSFGIHSPTDTANALKIMLENSPNPYVQMFCFSRLKQLVSTQFTIFDQETKLQLRTFLLEYAYLHPELQPFVMRQLSSVLALCIKFGWLDLKEYRDIGKDLKQFIQASSEHRIVGLQILSVVIQDIHLVTIPKYAAKFRKAAAELRDTQLLTIFEDAFNLLKSLLSRSIPFDKPDQENRTIDATLNLLLRCLSFDFAGTSLDESGEDVGMIQIPSTWRPLYESQDFVPTFFKAYHQFTDIQLCKKVLECLVYISATRRALFDTDETRTVFINCITEGTKDIIATCYGLTDSDCYNTFCRLLARFRAVSPLSDIMERPGYIEWIEVIAHFTHDAFLSTATMATSVHLLSFWAKIVQSMSYYSRTSKGGSVMEKLEDISVDLCRTFIGHYIAAVPNLVEQMLDDPLEDEENLIDSMNLLGQIARCKYIKSSEALFEIFNPVATQFEQWIHRASMMNEEDLQETLVLFENKFAWLVYAAAAFLGNRPAYSNSEECDTADGELITKVIQLMHVNQSLQQGLTAVVTPKLDASLVYFFSQYRKSYVGETNAKAVYKKPMQMFGIENQDDMLNLIMRKIMSNLQVWQDDVEMIRKSLTLLNELASGYSPLRAVRKLETTAALMQNHYVSGNNFSFLNHEKHRQSRSLYYQILSKLLFAEDDDGDVAFYEFMKPFEQRLDELSTLVTIEDFQQPRVQRAIQDIFRDLRGFLIPISNRKNYQLFFNWFYPNYMAILLRGLEALSPAPSAHILLKFFEEFVHNRNQRLNLDISSPNGILIFRNASQVLNSYGQHVIGHQISDENQKYSLKYKGVAICFNILSRCLGGKYINFGVFWLYQDKAIEDAFNMMFRFMLNTPLDDIMNYPKLTTAFFMMLEEFTKEQITFTASILPSDAFLYILEACEQGLGSSLVLKHACSAITSICTFAIQDKEEKWFLSLLNSFPHVLPRLLTTVFGFILFDDNNDQWQLSRPLYTLVLLQRDFASKYTNQVILQQLPERREFVTKALSNLMNGSGWSLSTKDRERFSQQVATLKRELNNNQVVLVPS